MQSTPNATKPGRSFLFRVFLPFLLSPAAAVWAQENPPVVAAAAQPSNPITANSKFMYRGMKFVLLRSAEKVPEESYAFKPTDGVRGLGQVLGHVADSQYTFCSEVLGEKNPAPGIEKSKTSKADLIAGLKDAFAYCDKAYDSVTDASAGEMVKHFGTDMPKLGVLTANLLHTVEHYGNLVTYMRMKNIVPPTSEPEFMKEMMKK
jgi:uncharacterized damage-inducible protein DinB